MNLGKILLATAMAGTLALSGCAVDQTKEARVPDVDVSAQGGQAPEFDVDTADVEVTSEEKAVEVPDVDVSTEKKDMTVPDVDVQMPQDKDK